MERISALMDGELERDEVAKLIPGVKERGDLRDAWTTYHLIGEVLRGEANSVPSRAIVHAVAARLADEPTVLAPRRTVGESLRRIVLPSFAAAAAVAAVTWISLETQQGPGGGAVVAVPASHLMLPAAMMQQPSVLPDFALATHMSFPPPPSPTIQLPARRIDAYLLAHQEFSPSTTMQGLAPYVRTVTSGSANSGIVGDR